MASCCTKDLEWDLAELWYADVSTTRIRFRVSGFQGLGFNLRFWVSGEFRFRVVGSGSAMS